MEGSLLNRSDNFIRADGLITLRAPLNLTISREPFEKFNFLEVNSSKVVQTVLPLSRLEQFLKKCEKDQCQIM